MASRIAARTLKGFRDYPPALAAPRERLVEAARRVYRSYGYAPIDTPALEYLEVLTGKGSEETDKQLYRFEDHGGRWVGLRFDLTVPLARFAAQHAPQLGLPFKRYHIASVWRGENPQKGRYREFIQADFDTVGTTAVGSDVETLAVLRDLLVAGGFERFTLHVNHRGLLDGVLEKAGLADQSTAVLRALDKLAKIGAERVADEITSTTGASTAQAEAVLALASIGGDNRSRLAETARLIEGSSTGEVGLERLTKTLAALEAIGLDDAGDAKVRFDPSIARGLDYYTGIVIETLLDDLPGIGSVASGGRYDDLAGLYSNQPLPGIGASLGVDRLLAAMEELDRLADEAPGPDVLVVYFAAERLDAYLKLAAAVREAGLSAELYPEPKKLAKQLQHANRRGHRVALIAGPDELSTGLCQVKDLATGQSETTSLADAPAAAARIVADDSTQ